uniref:Retrovirus-related Pol polyprotein from transposon TNT 1-94 n=1 Tax=Tanacetum cinerariifolium TaxID=118510 RepID=A0A699GXB4_TANCI|nr:retrovirus-related Pol polyprotein from transposon TNT 1-94 [Tanacetum cinerariifolium]
MQEELNQFIANDVWELVLKPRNMKIIGTKWVFKNKLDGNGVVSRNKPRLVAQGYNQQEGINYYETYAPVARLESIRILLAYACALDFKLFQMDVKSAFLNGFINEEKQTALAISTTEAKYVSARKACQQVLWMKQALIDYDVRLEDVPIMCDNKGAIDLSKNPVQHSRTKHIEISHHYHLDNVKKGHISIEKVSSVDNIADILTKPLQLESFNYLRGHKDHVSLCLCHMLYCIESLTPYNLAFFILKRMETTQNKPKELLPYGMLLTRLFKHVVSVSHELALDHYLSHDRAMYPLAPHYERKTQSDHGKKRPRESNTSSSSSFTTQNHPSSSLPLDAIVDENNDESFHSNSSSPYQSISSSSNVVPRVYQNLPYESHDLNTYISETINIQTQQRDAHRNR